ncbi:hypothetical protein O181_000261 [Austropuccinia psidii MF-1]|uniref:Uncharacterized protein n=1 Tax=Austropuccinia psidii MF-1 TaxID=1389203 RepID=A0A9Q3B8A4_9BASI|nr:hypothetical protein [Austropuccinia psidii MF-1]
MQQSVTINNTQQVVSMIPPTTTPFVSIVSSAPQSINPQLLLQAHPNDIPHNSPPSMRRCSAEGINVTINTQEIQSTISTPQSTQTPCVRLSPHDTSIKPPHPSCDDVPPQSTESNSSPPLHFPTPGLNNLNQEVDFQTQNPPILVETEEAPISQPTPTPNVEFSILSNEFHLQFFVFNKNNHSQSEI